MPQRDITASRLALASIGVAIAVLSIKYLAYRLTGSVALYSDALESIVNVVTAIAALIAIRISQRPPDRHHQFGHHKAEYFSAVAEGALIVVAALMIMAAAWQAFLSPRAIAEPGAGLTVSGIASLINGAWAAFLISKGRQLASPALTADGFHLLSDVLTSVGVIIGLALSVATGWARLDPLLALMVAASILYSGSHLIGSSMSGLMDHAVDAAVAARIRAAITKSGAGAIQAHDIRTRQAARATFIEFHLVVPGSMTVAEAHAICDRVEAAIKEEIPGADIVIHIEPEQEARQKGVLRI